MRIESTNESETPHEHGAEGWRLRALAAEALLDNILAVIGEASHQARSSAEDDVPDEIKKEAYEFRRKRAYDKLLTVPQAADVIGCSPATIYSYITSGILKAARCGERWRIRESAVRDFARPRPGNPRRRAES